MDHAAHVAALPLEEAAESLSSLPAEWQAVIKVSGWEAYVAVAGLGAETRHVEYADADDGKRRRAWIAEAKMLGGVRVIATWTEVVQ